MERVCLLLCYLTCLSAAAAKISIHGELPSRPENVEDKSSNQIADIGVLMKNVLTMTDKLRSDIRAHTGHINHQSGHSHTQGLHGDRGDDDGEPRFKKPSCAKPLHKKCKCGCKSKDSKRCKQNGGERVHGGDDDEERTVQDRPSLSDGHRLSHKFEARDQVKSRDTARVQGLTDEELEALMVEFLRQDVAWIVRGRDGKMHQSTAPEIDKVLELKNNIVLPNTYKMPPTKDLLDSLNLQAPKAPGNLPKFIFSLERGRAIVPMEMLSVEPYSSIGSLKQKDWYCTGAFIGPRHVLTTAQCIYESGEWEGNLDFTLGNDGGVRYEWEKVIVPDQWVRNRNFAHNFGMIVVKSDTPKHTTMNFGWHDDTLPSNDLAQVFLMGYRMLFSSMPEQPARLGMWRDLCTMRTEQDSVLLDHTCHISDVEDRGSPLFSPYSNDPVITCINIGWNQATELGTCLHISKQIFSSLYFWIERY